MPKLSKEKIKEKIVNKQIVREQDLLLYEEIEGLKQEIEAKIKVIDEMLKSDKIFKDLFYSARGQTSGENLLSELLDYLKKDNGFIEGLKGEKGKDAQVDYKFILAEVLKNIRQPKDGKDPIIDYQKIEREILAKIPRPEPIDADQIATKATESVIESIKPLIPKIDDLEKELPILGEGIRDSLELLRGEERLDKKAIRGLDDYQEIAQLARQKATGGGGGSVARNFYQLFDVPQTYADQGNKLLKVNSDETAIEFGLRITVADTQPTGPATGDLWVDTSGLGPV